MEGAAERVRAPRRRRQRRQRQGRRCSGAELGLCSAAAGARQGALLGGTLDGADPVHKAEGCWLALNAGRSMSHCALSGASVGC